MHLTTTTLDLVEELRLRRWARENYIAEDERTADWHPFIHDEMARRDRELQTAPECRRSRIVPLLPTHPAEAGPEQLRRPLAATAQTPTSIHFG